MPSRRVVLKALLLASAAIPAAALLPVAGRPPPPGGLHLVDGWILTDRDLERIRAHDR